MNLLIQNAMNLQSQSLRFKFIFLMLSFFYFDANAQISVLNKNGAVTSDPLQAINQYGAMGSAMGLSRNGALVATIVRSVGDAYQGGTIFYITAPDSDGIQHGLIRTDIITSNVSYDNTISTTIPNANTNDLNGYSDWRLPNYNEAVAICQTGGMSSGTWLMSSTVTSYAPLNIEVVYKSGCSNSNLPKTYTSITAILVRGF